MKKLIIAALLFVPMSAYAGGFPDPFDASNTAKDAYNWIQQSIPEMAQTKTEASNAILDEQVLQTTVNTDFANAKDYTNQALNYPALKDRDSCFTEDSFTHRSYDL